MGLIMINLKLMADISGWIGNVGFILGAIYLAKRKIAGFWYQIIANFMYLIQAVIFSSSSLFVISLVLIVFNSWGIYNWSRDFNTKE